MLQFAYSRDGISWADIGPLHDFGTLSEEYCGKPGFAGVFLGVCLQDLMAAAYMLILIILCIVTSCIIIIYESGGIEKS
ncbi:hypothetical protein [Paenibacillus sp. N3.4]|uniref:beta-xylosidase family glycoside hydrolase n=1 Tax=Paenibacillus sp. N3.4 TaxID=2603222 RepID=UPI00164EEC9C